MSAPDYLRNVYIYTAWADDLVLGAADRLTDEQLRSRAGGSRGSLVDNLAHVIFAQVNWVEAWRGEGRGARPEPPRHDVGTWLRAQAAQSHAALDAFIDGLDEGGVGRIVELQRGGLRRREWPLWQLMAHVALHSTQHRAESAMVVTELGHSPGDLDYGHFVDSRKSASAGTVAMMHALYGYNTWANRRLLAAMEGMSDHDLLKPHRVSHASLGIDLLHAMLAERGWLGIWQGGAPEIHLPGAASGSHLDNLVDGMERCDAAIAAFIDTLSDAELIRPRIDNADGHNPSVEKGRAIPLWDMMWHVLNHSMQHRSEAAMALTGMGRSPGDLDLLDYLDEPA